VVRADLETLRVHGLAMRAHLPHLVPAYAALSVESVRLAVRSGRLDPDRAEAVLALLERMVSVPLPAPTVAAWPAAPAEPAARWEAAVDGDGAAADEAQPWATHG
jgi:hypothetical protein